MMIRMSRSDGPDLELTFPLIPRIHETIVVNGQKSYEVEKVEYRTKVDETYTGYTNEVVVCVKVKEEQDDREPDR